MLEYVDSFLNKITMYKIVLYYLMALWAIAFIFGAIGWLPYSPLAFVISLAILVGVAWAANTLFAYVFDVPANVESIYITAFILALIITPAKTPAEYVFLGWAAVLAMASKYIFAINHKHIFNPAAFAVAITALTINQAASWWVATLIMLPFVLVGGVLIVRKIVRTDLALAFFGAALITTLVFTVVSGGNVWTTVLQVLVRSPIFFFTFIMITEPLTTPPSRLLRILYGTLVGFLFAPQVHIGSFYLTPEIALLFGNVFSYLISPKKRLTLKLKESILLTPDTAEFVFQPDAPLHFKPGQYLEWTLGHNSPDSRGNRRYFTIASSPTESKLRLSVKFYPKGSTFKKALARMKKGNTIIASQLAGDFVMPRNKRKKLVFIAGGIGVTPFRSMVQYMIDTGEKRDVTMLYSNKTADDIAYKDFFDVATTTLEKFKMVYTVTDKENKVPWTGNVGRIDERMILREIPDYISRTFYISGTHAMVSGTEQLLRDLNVPESQIKTDFFPGFA